MTPDELRWKLASKLDSLLAHRLLVRGEDRILLTALRVYVADMPLVELERVISLMPMAE